MPKRKQRKLGACRLCEIAGRIALNVERCEACDGVVSTANTSGRGIGIGVKVAEEAIRDAVARRKLVYEGQPGRYVCAYGEIMLLDRIEESARGDYRSVDHVVPGSTDRAALCSRFINDLKGMMTGREFRAYVRTVLETAEPRLLHSLTEGESGEFLRCLKKLMDENASEPDRCNARAALKRLTAKVGYP